jgi:hypothetical protein
VVAERRAERALDCCFDVYRLIGWQVNQARVPQEKFIDANGPLNRIQRKRDERCTPEVIKEILEWI